MESRSWREYAGDVRRAVALVALAAAGTALAVHAATLPGHYVSKRYGYTLELSADWKTFAWAGTWKGDIGEGIPGTDSFANDKLGIRAFIAARAAGPHSLVSWTAAMDHNLPGGCKPSGRLTPIKIGGWPAAQRRFRCPDGYAGRQFSLIRKQRAIGIGAVWPEGADEKPAAAGWQRVLATLHFTR